MLEKLKTYSSIIGVVTVLILVVTIGFFGYGLVKEMKTKFDSDLAHIDKELMLLGNTVVKTDTQAISKSELEDLLKARDATLLAWLDSHGFTPTGDTHVGGSVPGGSQSKPGKPGHKPPGGNPVVASFMTRLFWPTNKLGQTLAIGEATYYPATNRFENSTYPLNFSIDVTTAVDKNGKESNFASMVASGDSTQYVIPITELNVHKNYPKENTWHTVPHVDVGGSGMISANSNIGITVGITPFAYGKTRDDNIIRGPRIGLAGRLDGEDGDLWLELQGGANVGKAIPGLSDTWIYGGPCVDVDGDIGGCLSITSTL